MSATTNLTPIFFSCKVCHRGEIFNHPARWPETFAMYFGTEWLIFPRIQTLTMHYGNEHPKIKVRLGQYKCTRCQLIHSR